MNNDLISRRAAIDALCDNCNHVEAACPHYPCKQYIAIENLPSTQPELKWIPVKMRPMDEEEREYWEDHFGYELTDEDAVLFDCQMPDDEQEILVSYRKWINMDKCEIDDGCYGLEGNGDWDGVVAWMPLPEPYEE